MKLALPLLIFAVSTPVAHAPTIAHPAITRWYQHGEASFYDPLHKHVRTYGKVSGRAMIAAHRTLRPGSLLLVQSLSTRREVVVEVCGWGPAAWTGRILDLSRDSFKMLGSTRLGHIPIRIAVLHNSKTGTITKGRRAQLLRGVLVWKP